MLHFMLIVAYCCWHFTCSEMHWKKKHFRMQSPIWAWKTWKVNSWLIISQLVRLWEALKTSGDGIWSQSQSISNLIAYHRGARYNPADNVLCLTQTKCENPWENKQLVLPTDGAGEKPAQVSFLPKCTGLLISMSQQEGKQPNSGAGWPRSAWPRRPAANGHQDVRQCSTSVDWCQGSTTLFVLFELSNKQKRTRKPLHEALWII